MSVIIIRKVGFFQQDITNIYVGRKNSYKESFGFDASFLGNPEFMHNECEREQVCNFYEKVHFPELLKDKRNVSYLKSIKVRLNHGVNFALICFCHPKRCHAETIKNYIDNFGV